MYVADRAGGVAPYLAASCKCGWVGKAVDAETAEPRQPYQAVLQEAQGHATNVDPTIGWPLDRPSKQWRQLFEPSILPARQKRTRSVWGDVRETGPLLLVAVAIGGFLLVWLIRGPDLVDVAAAAWGLKARMIPLAVVTTAGLLLMSLVTFRVYTGRDRPPLRRDPIKPSPNLWKRLTDGRYYDEAQQLFTRPTIARVWTAALLLAVGWVGALLVFDIVEQPLTIDTYVRTYCEGRHRTHYFATADGRRFALAWGSGMPCVIPEGRYRLTLSAATNSVLAYDALE